MIHDEIRRFEDGRAQARRGGGWLSIDKDGIVRSPADPEAAE